MNNRRRTKCKALQLNQPLKAWIQLLKLPDIKRQMNEAFRIFRRNN